MSLPLACRAAAPRRPKKGVETLSPALSPPARSNSPFEALHTPCLPLPSAPLPPPLQSTMLVALLQPAPETFDLFDDVMLLASGMVRRGGGGAGGEGGGAPRHGSSG